MKKENEETDEVRVSELEIREREWRVGDLSLGI